MTRTNILFGIISEMEKMGKSKLVHADIKKDGTGMAVIQNEEGNSVCYNVKSGGILEPAK